MRIQLARYRFQLHVTEQTEDIARIVRWLPPWTLGLSVADAPFSLRLKNGLQHNNINRISDFRYYSLHVILDFPALGKKSGKDLLAGLAILAMRPPLDDMDVTPQYPAVPSSTGTLQRNSSDPCVLARTVSNRVANFEVNRLNISVRVENALKLKGVLVIGDLAGISSAELLRLSNFGRRSLDDLYTAIKNVVENDLESDALNEAPTGATGQGKKLIDHLEDSFEEISERSVEILKMRMGWDADTMTLASIGEAYGVTRERIRQLESKAVQKIERMSDWPKLFRTRLDEALSNSVTPVLLLGQFGADEWFEKTSKISNYLVGQFGGSNIHVIKYDGTEYIARVKQTAFDEGLKQAKDFLRSQEDKRPKRSDLAFQLQSLIPPDTSEFRELIVGNLLDECQFVTDGDEGVLVALRHSRGNAVRVVLEEADGPLHFSEITKRASKLFGESIDERRAHNAAAEVGILLGRGTFGLRRHIPFSDETLKQVAKLAEETVKGFGRYRQWHSAELVEDISDFLEAQSMEFDSYMLDYALGSFSTLRAHGRQIWDAPEIEESIDTRVEKRQAIISILERAGKPLTSNEIQSELLKIRGTATASQIFTDDVLLRIRPGLWGLNDRDAPIPLPEQAEYRDFIVEMLETRRSGIHKSEVVLISGIAHAEPDALISIAVIDERIAFSNTQHLYLQEWGDARSLTVAQATQKVMETSSEPCEFNFIVNQVRRQIGRNVSTTAVSNALRSIDALEAQSGKWKLDRTLGRGDEFQVEAQSD